MENDSKNQMIGKAREKLPADISNDSISLALKDEYLYDLMEDWLKEKNEYIKDEMLKEIINYTYEVMRIKGL